MMRFKISVIPLYLLCIMGCRLKKSISYECDPKVNNIVIIDTIDIERPLRVMVYEGDRANKLILPFSELHLVKKHSKFNDLLKNGGYLLGSDITMYLKLSKEPSYDPIKLNNLKKIGKNTISEYEAKVSKFIALSVPIGCYNAFESHHSSIDLRGKRSDHVIVLFHVDTDL